MDGATFFDPFVLSGADQDRVEVVDAAAGTELINYSYPVFDIVYLTIFPFWTWVVMASIAMLVRREETAAIAR